VDTDDEKGFAARLFVFPFQRAGVKTLQKFGLGVGGSYARTEGAASLPSGNGFATEGQQQFFTYRTSSTAGKPNVVADGDHWRISPQASWHCGPWSAIAEYVFSSQELRRSDTGLARAIRNSAWQVAAGYVLTGEDASERGVVPLHPFNPHENSWGALELVARVSSLKVDDAAFPLFADPATSASEAMAWAIGFNWYLNKNLRASANFFRTDFRGGRGGDVTAQDENAIFTRLQFSF
jgi:phosphate-selective porin OprO/OprP